MSKAITSLRLIAQTILVVRGQKVLLTADVAKNLKCQIGISSWGGRRASPHVFTEQGVAMLSSVLKSERAVRVKIAIMPAPYRTRNRR